MSHTKKGFHDSRSRTLSGASTTSFKMKENKKHSAVPQNVKQDRSMSTISQDTALSTLTCTTNGRESCVSTNDTLAIPTMKPNVRNKSDPKNAVEAWMAAEEDIPDSKAARLKIFRTIVRSFQEAKRIRKLQGGNAEYDKPALPPEVFASFQTKNPYRVGANGYRRDTRKLSVQRPRESSRSSGRESRHSRKYTTPFLIPGLSNRTGSIASGARNSIAASSGKTVLSTRERSWRLAARRNLTESKHAIRSEATPPELKVALHGLRRQMRERQKIRSAMVLTTPVMTVRSHGSAFVKVEREKAYEPPLRKFIRKSWLVFMLCKVCRSLRKYAFEGGVDTRSFESYSPHDLLSADDSTLQYFNPADYKSLGEATWHISAWESIHKPIGERTAADRQVIRNIMLSIKEFSDYPIKVQEKICQYIRYVRFAKNRVVIRIGDDGYQYYYIYSGKVYITYATRGKSLYSKGASIKKLSRGGSFGEQATLEEGYHKHTVTVVCCENCELLTLDSQYFQVTGFIEVIHARMDQQYRMIRGFELLGSWSDEDIADLSNSSVTEYHGYEKVVVDDGRHNDFIYICLQGRCDIMRAVNMNTSQLYVSLLSPHTMADLQQLEKEVQRQPGITLRDEQILDAISWWPEYKYEEKLSDLKQLYDRHLDMSRDFTVCRIRNGPKKKKEKEEEDTRSDTLRDEREQSTKSRKASGLLMTTECQVEIGGTTDMKTPHGVFMNVGELSKGLWFGVKEFWGNVCKSSLISKGCSLIRVPKSKIYENLDIPTVMKLRICAMTEQIPNDPELGREIISRMLWRDAAAEIGRQIYVEKCLKRSVDSFVRATTVGGTIKDRDSAEPKYFNNEKERSLDRTHRLLRNIKHMKCAETNAKGRNKNTSTQTLRDMADIVVAVMQRSKNMTKEELMANLKKPAMYEDTRNLKLNTEANETNPVSLVQNRHKKMLRVRRKAHHWLTKTRLATSDSIAKVAHANRLETLPQSLRSNGTLPGLPTVTKTSKRLEKVPRNRTNTATCKPLLTKALTHNGNTTVHLIRGIHSPLTEPAARNVITGVP